MRGHRGYNICPWLKTGKNEISGKSCREEYCKAHRHNIRNGNRIPRPCLNCGIGVRSRIQLCRGCSREKERQRLYRLNRLLRDQNPIEGLQQLCITTMGRGRKGIADQSLRKTKRTDSNLRGQIAFASVKNRETKKIPVPEHVVDFMKNMNPQQLADFLLSNHFICS